VLGTQSTPLTFMQSALHSASRSSAVVYRQAS